MKRALKLAFAFIVLAEPAVVRAETVLDFGGRCTPGAFRACASVSLGLAYDPTNELTRFTIRFSNLQSLTEDIPTSGSYGIRGFFFTGLTGTHPSFSSLPFAPSFRGVTVTTEVSAVNGTTPWVDFTGTWTDSPPPGSRTPGSFIAAPSNGNNLIFGCDGLPVNWPSNVAAGHTCGGSIVLVTNILGHWDFTDQTAMSFNGLQGNLQGFDSCTTGVDCIAVTVTPEPVSMVLLGTGLIGMVGAGALRRKRESRATSGHRLSPRVP